MKRRRFIVFMVVGIGVLGIGAGTAYYLWLTPQARFLGACGRANHVIVDLNVYDDGSYQGAFRKFDIHDSGAAQELVGCLAFEPDTGEFCACRGAMVLRFLKDDDELAAVSFHHGKTLRWGSRRGYHELVLKPESSVLITDWLRRHNCPGPDEALAEQVRIVQTRMQERRGTTQTASQPATRASVQSEPEAQARAKYGSDPSPKRQQRLY